MKDIQVVDTNSAITNEEVTAFMASALFAIQDGMNNLAASIKEMDANRNTILDHMDGCVKDMAVSMVEMRDTQKIGFSSMKDYLEKSVVEMVGFNSDYIAEQKENRQILSSLADKVSSSEGNKQLNPMFYSQMTKEKEKLWITSVRGRIANICMKSGYTESSVERRILKKMNDNYDIEKCLKEYRTLINPKADYIDMISDSEILRNNYMIQVMNIEKEIKSNKPIYIDSCGTPESIRKIVSRMPNYTSARGGAYTKAYNLIGIKGSEYAMATAKKLGVNKCSTAFAISLDENKVKELEKAVDEYCAKKGA